MQRLPEWAGLAVGALLSNYESNKLAADQLFKYSETLGPR